MSVRYGLRLDYMDLFDDKLEPFESYIRGISKETFLKAITYLVNTSNPVSKHHNASELIQDWFSKENEELRFSLLQRIPKDSSITSIISSLKLVEYVLKNDFEEDYKMSKSEFEINLLKAYLVLNSQQTTLEEKSLKYLPSESDSERSIALFLTQNFHDSDLNNFDIKYILINQLIKAIEFFQYFQHRVELQQHLTLFLSKYQCASWEDWLKKILSVIIPCITRKAESYFDFIIEEGENYNIDNLFLESLSVADEENFKFSDFIALRSCPLIKINNGHYRVLNSLFLVEKIFKSIQFQFSLQINKEVSPEFRLKDFRGDHCDKFSERTLLYKAVKNSFPKKWIHITGTDFTAQEYTGEPDYYVRFKNKIFIFESKDVVLKGEEKQSRNYLILKKALEEKFYKIQEGNHTSPKAVLQLVENIKRILDKYYNKCDVDYDSENVRIYPILVIHDRQFDSIGVNKLITVWFKEELEKIKLMYDISKIQDIIVLNIDTLLFYQESFRNRNEYRLEELISKYNKEINFNPAFCKSQQELRQKTFNSFQPFSHFVDLVTPKSLMNLMPSYIKEYIQMLGNNIENTKG